MKDFKLPDLGEGVHEGQVVRLCIPQGGSINEDEPLMEVETDKASVEIPSPFTGTITKWHVTENQLIHVGDTMVTFELSAAATTTSSSPLPTGEGPGVRENVSARTEPSPSPTQITTPSSPRRASPAVRKLARQRHVDINTITGTGPNGRITRADVENAAVQNAHSPTRPADLQPSAPSRSLPVTPVTGRSAAPAPTAQSPPLPEGADEADQWGALRRVPISMPRRTIAANMIQSWSTIPHVTDCQDADITHLDKIRRGYSAPENDQSKLTILSFVVRAVALALTRRPVFNAVFDAAGEAIVYHKYVNIAIGVHTQRGLITPVIRNADQLSIREIAAAVDVIGEKAHSASFDVADLRGGTYTISNVGALGQNRYSTPIIPPGQCAVLALGRARLQPWIVENEIVPRLILPLSHSFDHRIADGGDEVQFLNDIVGALENPARILI